MTTSQQDRQQDQRMLVLLCAALVICLVHAYQFPFNKKTGTATNIEQNQGKLVWLSGDVPAGFYSIPEKGISSEKLFSFLNIPAPEHKPGESDVFIPEPGKSYNIEHGLITEQAMIPAPAAPFYFQPINLNGADVDLLETLPGIGKKLAQEIVRHREIIGGFTALEEMLEVKGVGEKKFKGIKKFITL